MAGCSASSVFESKMLLRTIITDNEYDSDVISHERRNRRDRDNKMIERQNSRFEYSCIEEGHRQRLTLLIVTNEHIDNYLTNALDGKKTELTCKRHQKSIRNFHWSGLAGLCTLNKKTEVDLWFYTRVSKRFGYIWTWTT